MKTKCLVSQENMQLHQHHGTEENRNENKIGKKCISTKMEKQIENRKLAAHE